MITLLTSTLINSNSLGDQSADNVNITGGSGDFDTLKINGDDVATKDYADSLVLGLFDYRGDYNASSNVFPSSGGSGTGGAILKGDVWSISVAGTLGGTAVNIGDLMYAKVDSPGQTASNWYVQEANLGYSPANLASANTWTAPQRVTSTILTDAPTINIDFGATQDFEVVLSGTRILGEPTNIVKGQSGVIDVRQDGTGGRALTYAWCYVFPLNVVPVLSTGKYDHDQLQYRVNEYSSGTFTVTLASPGVFTKAVHGFKSGQRCRLTTSGALPTGLATGTTYFIYVIDANTFYLSTSKANLQAGVYINTSGSQSGIHTITAASILISMNPSLGA